MTINLIGKCALHGERNVSDARKRIVLPRSVKKFLVRNIESEEELEEIGVVRVPALRGRAVYAG